LSKTKVSNKNSQRNAENACGNGMCKRALMPTWNNIDNGGNKVSIPCQPPPHSTPRESQHYCHPELKKSVGGVPCRNSSLFRFMTIFQLNCSSKEMFQNIAFLGDSHFFGVYIPYLFFQGILAPLVTILSVKNLQKFSKKKIKELFENIIRIANRCGRDNKISPDV